MTNLRITFPIILTSMSYSPTTIPRPLLLTNSVINKANPPKIAKLSKIQI